MTEDALNGWLDTNNLRLRRRIRLVMLLDAADYAAIAPIANPRLHAFAFLADVLSPIYDLSAITGRIMKRRSGPYFPDLQWELDRLVGQGLVDIHDLKFVGEISRTYIDADCGLNRKMAAPILRMLEEDDQFYRLRDFLRELASALGTVPDADLDATTQSDVTWESGHAGTVIDYGEWRARNYSAQSAHRIEAVANKNWPGLELDLSPGAKVNLYVQYLKRAANAG